MAGGQELSTYGNNQFTQEIRNKEIHTSKHCNYTILGKQQIIYYKFICGSN